MSETIFNSIPTTTRFPSAFRRHPLQPVTVLLSCFESVSCFPGIELYDSSWWISEWDIVSNSSSCSNNNNNYSTTPFEQEITPILLTPTDALLFAQCPVRIWGGHLNVFIGVHLPMFLPFFAILIIVMVDLHKTAVISHLFRLFFLLLYSKQNYWKLAFGLDSSVSASFWKGWKMSCGVSRKEGLFWRWINCRSFSITPVKCV